MEVRKIMTKNPATCTPDSTLQEVAHMMEMYDCGCIPVVEDHKTNMPVGTITDRDIAVRTFAANLNPLEMKASDIMTTDIATVTSETTVEQCRDQMEERQIRRILVVDNKGRCIGIVAQADVVQNETNAGQTAEFIRDISKPSHSEDNEIYSERESYQNFAMQNSRDRAFSENVDRANKSSFKKSKQGRKLKKSYKKQKSFFSFGSLMPILIGVGTGAALKYFLLNDQKAQTTFVPRSKVTSSLRDTETTPKVSIELPTETDIHSKNSGNLSGVSTTSTTKKAESDSDTNPEIGRTARL